MKAKILLAALLTIILVSCTAVNTPAPTAVIVSTASIIPVSPSPTPKLTIISTPTATLTFTPTSTITLTPLPTLESNQKLRLVEDLLTNNNNCKLPCWWGFIPGKTEWQVAQNFLQTVSRIIYPYQISETTFFYLVDIPVPKEIFHSSLGHNYTVRNGIIESIEVSTGRTKVYSLPNVLANYGQPSEIWISWINTKPNRRGYFPIYVMLYYQNQGILVQYLPRKLTVTDETMIGCPQEDIFPRIFLWSPEFGMGKSFDEILKEARGFGKGLQYLPLVQATGINVEQFYSTFKDANNSICVETPIDLWEKGNDPFQ